MNITKLKESKGQIMIFLNVRSLYNHFTEIEAEFAKCNFLALCFNESWLNKSIPNEIIEIEGFNIVRLDRGYNKRGGGLITYVRSDFEVVNMETIPNISDVNIELLNIMIKRNHQRPLCISSIYLPPNSDIDVAVEKLSLVGDALSLMQVEWILGDDLNIDLNHVKSNKQKRTLYNFTCKYLLHQTIQKATRICATTATLIDHIYTNTPTKVNSSGVICYGLSDHHLVFILLKKNIEKKNKVSFSCRNLKRYSLPDLEQNLDRLNWEAFYQQTKPCDCWEILYNSYLKILDCIAPMVHITNVKEADCWVTPELLNLIRQRDNLKNELDNCGTGESYNRNLKEFRKKRSEVKRGVIVAKRNYTLAKLRSNHDNPRKYWSDLNRIMPTGKNKSKKKKEIIKLVDNDSNCVLPEDTAEFINNFFINIGPSLANEIKVDNSEYIRELDSHSSEKNMHEWRPTDFVEVTKAVKEIDICKNSNIENINAALFKDCLLCSIDQVVFLFNLILTTGDFPDSWKLATVIPLFKSGSKSSVSNFRPISLLPSIAKLLERIIHRRIYFFLDDN